MPLTITTWNVQNFDTTEPLFTPKRRLIVDTLRALDPDVIALQEIKDECALGALADDLGYDAHAAPPGDREHTIRVAFLTRHPTIGAAEVLGEWRIPPGVSVQQFGTGGQVVPLPALRRPALRVRVMHEGRPIDVITAHLKSKLLTFGRFFSTADETLRARTAYFALQIRAAEALTLREHVSDALADGRDVILLGDLNDGAEAATTQVLYGPPGSQPRGPEDATHALGAFQRADGDDARRLFNLCNLVPKELRWSRRHNGQNELLDHILASGGLLPRSASGLRDVPSVAIWNRDTPNLVGEHPIAGGVVPDHAPVTAAFA